MVKIENGHLLLSDCRYFDESFIEMFVEWSPVMTGRPKTSKTRSLNG